MLMRKRTIRTVSAVLVFLFVGGGGRVRSVCAAAEAREEKILEDIRADTAKISLQQKELKDKLRAAETSLSKVENSHEVLKQENRKLAQDLAVLKKIMRDSDGKAGERVSGKDQFYKQAESFILEGDFIRAIEALEKSVSLNPRNAEAQYRLGILYMHARGDERKGAYHLRRFLSLSRDPERKAEAKYLLRILSNDADRTH
jgi:Flp pilus assembly protein TadD